MVGSLALCEQIWRGGFHFVELLSDVFGRKVIPFKVIPFCETDFIASLSVILRRC
jgi:hypothetical protein